MYQKNAKLGFFSEKKPAIAFSSPEVRNIAENAKNYARDQIRKGASQLENNDLSLEYQNYLALGMDDNTGIRGYVGQELMKNGLEQNKLIQLYESYIRVSSKFSLGNCYELALQALDYILNNHIDINAEIFSIHNGDHAFLVLNRNPHSDFANPMTWGDNAFICDPWSNMVYLASDYMTNLKNFSREDNINYARTLSKDHALTPVGYNASYINNHRNTDNLKQSFLERCENIEQMVEYCIKKLEHENALLAEYNLSAISDKISQLKAMQGLITASKTSVKANQFDNDYRKANSTLTENLSNLCQKIANSLTLSPEESNNLNNRIPFQEKKYLYDVQELLVNLSYLHPTTIIFPENIEYLKQVFEESIEFPSGSLQSGKDSLEQERKRLVDKYGNKDSAAQVIDKKIKCIQKVQDKLAEYLLEVQQSNSSYQETHRLLNSMFIELSAEIVASVSFTKKEQEILFKSRDVFGELFNLPSDTKTNLSRLRIISLTVTDSCHGYFHTLSHPFAEQSSIAPRK